MRHCQSDNNTPKGHLELIEREKYDHQNILRKLNEHHSDEAMIHLLTRFDDSNDYLVQLVYILIKRNNENLLRYLLSKCAESIANFQIIKWAYNAFRKGYPNHESKFEEAMVNSVEDQDNMNNYLEKECRSNYAESIQIFIEGLTQISLNLKNIPTQERKQYLRKNLIKANRSLESLRRHNPERICQGIILPFKDSSQLVVRIIDTECQAFNTKKRVPYRIVIETIDINEDAMIKVNKQISTDTQAFLDYDNQYGNNFKILEDFLHNHAKDDLAKKQLFNQSLKRFNTQFPIKRLERRNSAITLKDNQKALQTQLQLYEVQKNNSAREVDQVEFFDFLLKNYPEKSVSIQRIQQILHVTKQNLEQQPYTGPFCEQWADREEQIRKSSPFNHYKSYKIRPILIKGGDDLRQEQMLMQLLDCIKPVFQQLGLYLKTYEIIITSVDSGILEFCTDTLSLDALKKMMPNRSLKQIYIEVFGDNFEEAQKNFVKSMVPCALIQYLFQIKDRHNGNILIDQKGHMIQIDFGFILSIAPGGIGFESAPFKFTKEYLDLIGGRDSDLFNYFKMMMAIALTDLRKYLPKIKLIIDIMKEESQLPCFEKFDSKVFEDRFCENQSEEYINKVIDEIVFQSCENKRTIMYDSFQKMTNGIVP